MINAAVCDDESIFANELTSKVHNFLNSANCEHTVNIYQSGSALLENSSGLDLIFLDVQMEGKDGFETAAALREGGFGGCLIFVTVMKEQMRRAFEYEAFDYLTKPLDDGETEHALCRFLRRREREDRQLTVNRRGSRIFIKHSDIIYGEVYDRRLILHLKDGSEVEYYGRLSDLEKELGSAFFRTHRSYIAALDAMTASTSESVTLSSGEKLPLSRSRRAALNSALLRQFHAEKNME